MRTLLFAGLLALAAFAQDKKPRVQSMEGCLDQDGPAYILREPSELTKIAELDAVNFKPDYFANFLSNRVTVYGRISNEGGTPVVHVTRIEKHPGACEPLH